jgi:hypothetical protein
MMILTYLKSIKNILTLSAIIIPLIAAYVLFKSNQSLKADNEKLTNNTEALNGILSKNVNDNYVLRMSTAEMRKSKDSLTVALSKAMKNSGFKEKNITSGTIITQTITDTLRDTVITAKDCSFDKTIKLNDQTSSRIILKKSKSGVDTLVNILSIKDSLSIIRGIKTPYKNDYSNFFMRLIHLDFKRDKLKAYSVKHSNDAIKNEDVRVIDVED